ncbi:MAG: L-serine ammonia-lyase, iron-sulfur-dependent, subunit alpha [Bacteroidales bacterium]|nr:L-serine ammonia-lyase, iron-sulfur-dependent, subunit alpha [Bacteroidales bacterium]
MTPRESEIIELIRREVKPALGCTEPIAVALAVAKAMETISDSEHDLNSDWRKDIGLVRQIDVKVSGNILKNGMGVGIPGTGMVGLHIAAALGAVCGNSSYGLEVLHDLDEESISIAKRMVEEEKVCIGIAETSHKLYVDTTVTLCNGHKANVVIEDDHDRIVKTSFDEQVLFMLQESEGGACKEGRNSAEMGLTIREIYDFAKSVAYEDIRFILDSRTLNMALAEEGLKGKYGLRVGRAIHSEKYKAVFGNDFLSYAMSLTAAASDARMAGCTLPAMSNSGSGNQGITVTMPVIAYSIKYGCDDESLARALVLSHLVAIHIKSYLGKLSALCGCVVASTGSSCGLVYLNGGSYEQVCYSIKNMIGNITGMVCDGAKVGCAMKVASGVSSSLQSAVLAMEDTCVSEHDGIIEKDIEKTIRNLGRIGSVGMQDTDELILDIMVCK